MAKAIFNYEGINTIIQCGIDDKMEDIIKKFLIKIQRKDDNNTYLYNGASINKELTFEEQANDLDKNRRKMNILVTKNIKAQNKKKPILSKDIICPECKQNILIEIKNFKIKLSGCKCNNNYNNILLNLFEETQKIDLCQINCNICKQNNKGNTHNNEFFICNTCNKSLCPLCKSIHDKKHRVINYDDKNYIYAKNIMILLLNIVKLVMRIYALFVKIIIKLMKFLNQVKYLLMKMNY